MPVMIHSMKRTESRAMEGAPRSAQRKLNRIVENIFLKWDEYFYYDRTGIKGAMAVNDRQVAYRFSFNFKLAEGAKLPFVHTVTRILSESNLLFSFSHSSGMRAALVIYSDPSLN